VVNDLGGQDLASWDRRRANQQLAAGGTSAWIGDERNGGAGRGGASQEGTVSGGWRAVEKRERRRDEAAASQEGSTAGRRGAVSGVTHKNEE